jgi:hypothetical protein
MAGKLIDDLNMNRASGMLRRCLALLQMQSGPAPGLKLNQGIELPGCTPLNGRGLFTLVVTEAAPASLRLCDS